MNLRAAVALSKLRKLAQADAPEGVRDAFGVFYTPGHCARAALDAFDVLNSELQLDTCPSRIEPAPSLIPQFKDS